MLSDMPKIKSSELVAYHVLKSAMAHFQQKPSELTQEQRSKVSKTAQKSYELERQILSSDEAKDIMIPTHSVAAALEELEGRYETTQEFLQDLKVNGLSFEVLQTSIRRELWVEAVLDRVSSQVEEVSENEVIEFYQKNHGKFHSTEKRKARHILITVNADYKENTPEMVQKRLGELQDKLSNGADFAKLASENSECPTALNGGEIGTVAHGQLYPEIDTVLFGLNEGEVSGPVKTEIGYHIVKCEEIVGAAQVSMFEAKDQIVAYLAEKKRMQAQKEWLKQLKS